MKSYSTSLSPYRRTLLAATVAVAAGSVAAFAQSSSPSSSSSPNSSNSAYNTPASNSGANMSSDVSHNTNASDSSNTTNRSSSEKLSWSDRRFVTKVAHGNQAEIQLAQLAVDRASNPDVKKFAQTLVDDHTQLGQQIQSLATSKNVTLKEETKEDREDKKLSKLSGADFDREFVKQMVSEHKKDVKEFQDRAEDSKDAELKSLVQSTLPKLQQHLQMAQQLEQSIVPTGHTGTDSWKSSSSSDTNASSSNASNPSSSSSIQGTPNAESTGSTSNASGTSSSRPSGATENGR